MSIPIYGPIVLLRCKKCSRKTAHVLIAIDGSSEKEEIEENYECQECGETKKIYEFATPHVHSLIQHSVKKGLKETQNFLGWYSQYTFPHLFSRDLNLYSRTGIVFSRISVSVKPQQNNKDSSMKIQLVSFGVRGARFKPRFKSLFLHGI